MPEPREDDIARFDERREFSRLEDTRTAQDLAEKERS
jgi:hypothetical protein